MAQNSPFFKKNKIIENEFAFAIFDGFAVSEGHTLVIPKRFVPSIFNLSSEKNMRHVSY